MQLFCFHCSRSLKEPKDLDNKGESLISHLSPPPLAKGVVSRTLLSNVSKHLKQHLHVYSNTHSQLKRAAL